MKSKINDRKVNPLITVIVPVYNVENYLRKCIDSILCQSYTNLEILLVDDGSTDNSGVLCDQYKKTDDRVTVFHKSNGGLSDARNYAMDRAKGDYFVFIDSDDYVSEDHVEYLYSLLAINNADISVANLVCIDERGKVLSHHHATGDIYELETDRALGELLNSKLYSNSSSAKLYKKELFAEIRFPKGRLYEDVATIYRVFLFSSKVVYGDRDIYYYLYRNSSISREIFHEKKLDLVFYTEKMVSDVVAIYPHLESIGKFRIFDGYMLLLSQCNDKAISDALLSKLKELRSFILFNKSSGLKRKICALSTFLGDWFIKWKIK